MSPILGIYASQISGHLWNVPSSYESIATLTASGNPSSLSFTSIPSTYKHLQIRGISRWAGGGSVSAYSTSIRINSVTTSIYAFHQLYGNGTSAASENSTNQTSIDLGRSTLATATLANTFGATIIDILDYADTNKFKTLRSLSGTEINQSLSTGGIDLQSCLWRSTSAINSITLEGAVGGWANGTTFALYGIKGVV